MSMYEATGQKMHSKSLWLISSHVLITKLRSTSIQFSLTMERRQFCSDGSTSAILDWQWKPFKIALVRVVSYSTL